MIELGLKAGAKGAGGTATRARAALARAYRLLGDLVAGPLSEELVERACQSPLLGQAIGAAPALDELAAEHHRAFEWSAFPHQGVYLDQGGWADGSSSIALRSLFSELGFVARQDLPADHLTNLLGALALSLDLGDGAGSGLARSDDAASVELELLDGHLLRWLPSFAAAVCRLGLGFPAALVSQLEDLALYHREMLAALVPVSEFVLEPSPSLLDEPETSLADIASFLLSTVRSGLFLSREDILFVVRSAGCFCGFGDRQTMLLNALRTAVQHERLAELCEALSLLHRSWEERLESRVLEGLPATLARPWIARSTDSRALLQVLGAAGRSFSSSTEAEPRGSGARES
jgi:TorA maturation chaperone TorD